MGGDDLIYYRRRAAEELLAAKRATCPKAIEAHLQMHERYLQIIAIEVLPVEAEQMRA